MSSREEFEAYRDRRNSELNTTGRRTGIDWRINNAHWPTWQASRAHESDLLAALKAITNSGPDAIPIKEAFEMAHRAIERATGGKV